MSCHRQSFPTPGSDVHRLGSSAYNMASLSDRSAGPSSISAPLQNRSYSQQVDRQTRQSDFYKQGRHDVEKKQPFPLKSRSEMRQQPFQSSERHDTFTRERKISPNRPQRQQEHQQGSGFRPRTPSFDRSEKAYGRERRELAPRERPNPQSRDRRLSSTNQQPEMRRSSSFSNERPDDVLQKSRLEPLHRQDTFSRDSDSANTSKRKVSPTRQTKLVKPPSRLGDDKFVARLLAANASSVRQQEIEHNHERDDYAELLETCATQARSFDDQVSMLCEVRFHAHNASFA